jgi:hypothetical protein
MKLMKNISKADLVCATYVRNVSTAQKKSLDEYLKGYAEVVMTGGSDFKLIQLGMQKQFVGMLHDMYMKKLHKLAVLLPSSLYGKLKKMSLDEQFKVITVGAPCFETKCTLKIGDMTAWQRQVIFDGGRIRTLEEQERYIATWRETPLISVKNGMINIRRGCKIPVAEFAAQVLVNPAITASYM